MAIRPKYVLIGYGFNNCPNSLEVFANLNYYWISKKVGLEFEIQKGRFFLQKKVLFVAPSTGLDGPFMIGFLWLPEKSSKVGLGLVNPLKLGALQCS